jgi:cell division protease FtsH
MPVETDNKPTKDLKPRQLGGSLLLLFGTLLILNLTIIPSLVPHPQQVEASYSDFVSRVQAGEVDRALIAPDRIQYVLKADAKVEPGTQTAAAKKIESYKRVYNTAPVAIDLDLPKILRENKVEFSAPPPSNDAWLSTLIGWIAPPLIFFG